ncbi:helix-hairpin-helix domain-containing protein [Luteitalea sp. TBR-22]|uniref:helix-hairpin-helix domain-containing protein n=1 Tax=Luteitalea sp. TBR-22 TaxID=2802971 RepID=UPI001EF4FBA3|nr:helix-hairpin-helix domain-containing protein [Luteitalea sp. TBR-22]
MKSGQPVHRAAVMLGLAWTVSVAWTSAPAAAPATMTAVGQVTQPADPPEQFKRTCIKCHTSDRVVQGRRFRNQWEELIEQMIARGAVVADEDYDVVIGYLVGEFGRVNVNSASAAELAEVLHLPPADADAIVAARKAAGKFADFEALIAAPGVPVDALKARRDAMVF